MIKDNNLQTTSTQLSELIVEAIQDKKGKHITTLDLRNIDEASADYYVICQGSSTTQVGAIAEHVIDEAYLQSGDRPISKEGLREGEWALVDFFHVVVHVFIEPVRHRYALEDLWGDAKIIQHQDLD